MRKYALLFLGIFLLAGCGTKGLLIDKSDGISKNESRVMAKEYMAGMEPCGFQENYDTWRWDFRVERPGYETTQTHVYVNKITGDITKGIR